VITNSCNTYGPWQFPEKLISLTIVRAVQEKPLLVYGSGRHTRDWLFIEDHAAALVRAFHHGRVGERYNVGGGIQFRNIQVVEAICSILDQIRPLSNQRSYKTLIEFVPDRPGHDYRYAMSSQKILTELGWSAQVPFEAGLRKTINWYLHHEEWWRQILGTLYDGRRLGGGSK
jgi:dTDP-glucose 4,6-dehydratase